MEIKSIYVSTPINGRSEKTRQAKMEAAGKRMEELRQMLQKEYPQARIVVPFDVVPPKDDITEAVALGRCITALMECDAAYFDDMLCVRSSGCRLENHAAHIYGKTVMNEMKWRKTDFKRFLRRFYDRYG